MDVEVEVQRRKQEGWKVRTWDRSTGRKGAGVVKWFNLDKGFGFIECNSGLDAGLDVFVHASDVLGRIWLGSGEGEGVEGEDFGLWFTSEGLGQNRGFWKKISVESEGPFSEERLCPSPGLSRESLLERALKEGNGQV